MRNMRSNNSRGGFGGKSRGNRFGGRSGGFGDRNHFRKGHDGARAERRVQMHDAICNNCGKKCQVPFRPTGSKPVLCRDCFQVNSGSTHNFSGNVQGGNEQFNQINAKLDRILRVLQDLEIDVEEDVKTDSGEESDDEDDVFDDEDEDDSDDEDEEEDEEDEKDTK